jgi:hypothetical protein
VTLLNGHWNLGINVISLFGALWVFPGVGFILATIALLMGWGLWQPAFQKLVSSEVNSYFSGTRIVAFY